MHHTLALVSECASLVYPSKTTLSTLVNRDDVTAPTPEILYITARPSRAVSLSRSGTGARFWNERCRLSNLCHQESAQGWDISVGQDTVRYTVPIIGPGVNSDLLCQVSGRRYCLDLCQLDHFPRAIFLNPFITPRRPNSAHPARNPIHHQSPPMTNFYSRHRHPYPSLHFG